jgi:hypothetical protein
VDRQVVYPGEIPLDTDFLDAQREAMIAIGYLAQAVLGTGPIADGLSCTATVPASMTVAIGAGSVTQFGVVDTTSYGSLPALPTSPLLKMGINLTPTNFALTAPTGPGQAISYLIEASMFEQDSSPVILPYYNALSPGQPFLGLNNNGMPQNTQRLQSVQLQLKAGAPANAGTQATPPVDLGWVGLYVVTVVTGQTVVNAASITAIPSAPFINWKLGQLTPGTRNLKTFTPATQGSWVVPSGVTVLRIRVWGGGGAGGAGVGGAGGGGGGGGYAEGFYNVAPGQSYFVTVGNGGVGSGTAGGQSSFGSLTSAAGGPAGHDGTSLQAGVGAASGGTGSGSGLSVSGGPGCGAFNAGEYWISGQGGSSYSGAGAVAVVTQQLGQANDGNSATTPGGGGGGGVGAGLGGQGGAGSVLVEW